MSLHGKKRRNHSLFHEHNISQFTFRFELWQSILTVVEYINHGIISKSFQYSDNCFASQGFLFSEEDLISKQFPVIPQYLREFPGQFTERDCLIYETPYILKTSSTFNQQMWISTYTLFSIMLYSLSTFYIIISQDNSLSKPFELQSFSSLQIMFTLKSDLG